MEATLNRSLKDTYHKGEREWGCVGWQPSSALSSSYPWQRCFSVSFCKMHMIIVPPSAGSWRITIYTEGVHVPYSEHSLSATVMRDAYILHGNTKYFALNNTLMSETVSTISLGNKMWFFSWESKWSVYWVDDSMGTGGRRCLCFQIFQPLWEWTLDH